MECGVSPWRVGRELRCARLMHERDASDDG